MEKDIECFKCGIGFPQIGAVTSKRRLSEHEKTPHVILCKECDRFFISMTHLRYHLEFHHDTKYNDCFRYCEQKCAENYAWGAEAAGKGEIEKGLAEKKEAVEDAEEQLECTYNHIETF